VRCLALAQAWKEAGGTAVFLLGGEANPWAGQLSREGIETLAAESSPGSTADAREMFSVAEVLRPAAVVIDGYGFTEPFQEAISRQVAPVLVVDDGARIGGYRAHLILDQNDGASLHLYRERAPAAELLVGARYVLLRHEFLSGRNSVGPSRAQARRVLVTMGGADDPNITLDVFRALHALDRPIDVTVLVGPAYGALEELGHEVRRHPSASVVVDPPNVAEVMATADLAVAAAGSTVWELACLGIPALVGLTSENQVPVATSLVAHGIGHSVGWFRDTPAEIVAAAVGALLDDTGARSKMREAGRDLVDGMGAARVVQRLLEWKAGKHL